MADEPKKRTSKRFPEMAAVVLIVAGMLLFPIDYSLNNFQGTWVFRVGYAVVGFKRLKGWTKFVFNHSERDVSILFSPMIALLMLIVGAIIMVYFVDFRKKASRRHQGGPLPT